MWAEAHPFLAMPRQQIASHCHIVSRPCRRPPAPEKLMLPLKARCGLLVLAIIALGGSVSVAQNLDQGKPAPKLFAESCATCHRSPRGLAKGRFNLTLYLFLQKHYSSSSSSAWALTTYLESVDSGKRAAAKSAAKAGTSRSRLLRPPAPVPSR
jgi:mono/diheme cytochrome c family protein